MAAKTEMDSYNDLWMSHKTINSVILDLLIEKGVDPNMIVSEGKTKLIWAAENDQDDLVAYLLKLPNIDVNKDNGRGHTALHYATQCSIVERLVKAGANIIYDCVKHKDLLKTPAELIQDQVNKFKEEDKITIAKSIAAQLTKEQKSKLIQDILASF
jgi:hypothetical protein